MVHTFLDFFYHEVFMLSMSSLVCFYLVTGLLDFIFCILTLANVPRKFKLRRLSSLVY